MANQEHLFMLRQGVGVWNEWYSRQGLKFTPDFSNTDLSGMPLSGASLSFGNFQNTCFAGTDLRNAALLRSNMWGADFRGASLSGANLAESDLSKANFSNADLRSAFLSRAKMRRTKLFNADLECADLREANISFSRLDQTNLQRAILRYTNFQRSYFCGADVRGADFSFANLVEVNFRGADISNSIVFGVSAWGLGLENTIQQNLIVTRPNDPVITTDNIEIAQFIYLLLNNSKIRDVINTIISKAVLILGRFTPERKSVLDALREKLRKKDYLPILFDFEQPSSRNLTETVSTLAHMSRFVIADITDAKSIPQELQRIIPNLPSLPIQPIILDLQYEYAMFKDFFNYPWVLPPYRYVSKTELLDSLDDKVIAPSETKFYELEERRKAFESKF